MTNEKELRETSEYKENLKNTLLYAKSNYCPGCGLSLRGLEVLLHSHTKEVVKNKIKGMRKDVQKAFELGGLEGDVAVIEGLAYNQALDDLLASLEDNKKA